MSGYFETEVYEPLVKADSFKSFASKPVVVKKLVSLPVMKKPVPVVKKPVPLPVMKKQVVPAMKQVVRKNFNTFPKPMPVKDPLSTTDSFLMDSTEVSSSEEEEECSEYCPPKKVTKKRRALVSEPSDTEVEVQRRPTTRKVIVEEIEEPEEETEEEVVEEYELEPDDGTGIEIDLTGYPV